MGCGGFFLVFFLFFSPQGTTHCILFLCKNIQCPAMTNIPLVSWLWREEYLYILAHQKVYILIRALDWKLLFIFPKRKMHPDGLGSSIRQCLQDINLIILPLTIPCTIIHYMHIYMHALTDSASKLIAKFSGRIETVNYLCKRVMFLCWIIRHYIL